MIHYWNNKNRNIWHIHKLQSSIKQICWLLYTQQKPSKNAGKFLSWAGMWQDVSNWIENIKSWGKAR